MKIDVDTAADLSTSQHLRLPASWASSTGTKLLALLYPGSGSPRVTVDEAVILPAACRVQQLMPGGLLTSKP